MLMNGGEVTIRSVLCSYSSTDADYAEIPDDDEDADYAHPMAGTEKKFHIMLILIGFCSSRNDHWRNHHSV